MPVKQLGDFTQPKEVIGKVRRYRDTKIFRKYLYDVSEVDLGINNLHEVDYPSDIKIEDILIKLKNININSNYFKK